MTNFRFQSTIHCGRAPFFCIVLPMAHLYLCKSQHLSTKHGLHFAFFLQAVLRPSCLIESVSKNLKTLLKRYVYPFCSRADRNVLHHFMGTSACPPQTCGFGLQVPPLRLLDQFTHHLLQVRLGVRHDPSVVCPLKVAHVMLSFAGIHQHAYVFHHPFWFDITQDLHAIQSQGVSTLPWRMHLANAKAHPTLSNLPCPSRQAISRSKAATIHPWHVLINHKFHKMLWPRHVKKCLDVHAGQEHGGSLRAAVPHHWPSVLLPLPELLQQLMPSMPPRPTPSSVWKNNTRRTPLRQ